MMTHLSYGSTQNKTCSQYTLQADVQNVCILPEYLFAVVLLHEANQHLPASMDLDLLNADKDVPTWTNRI